MNYKNAYSLCINKIYLNTNYLSQEEIYNDNSYF